MPPNPQIQRISVPSGNISLDSPYSIDRIEIRNDGDPGNIYLNCWCGAAADGRPEYPEARGRRLNNWSNVGHFETVNFSGTFYLTDEYAQAHGQSLGLCGGCNPDESCYQDPVGPTYFRYEVGYIDENGVSVETHSIWRLPLLTVIPADPNKGYITVATVLNNEVSMHAGVYLNGTFIGFGDGDIVAMPLDPGTYIVSFTEIQGWLKPDDITVTIQAGELVEVIGNYEIIVELGVLVVDTTPIAGNIFVNGRIVGVGSASVDLVPGEYIVSFGDINGYRTPDNINVIVEANRTVNKVGYYTEITEPQPEDSNFWKYITIGTIGLIGIVLARKRR